MTDMLGKFLLAAVLILASGAAGYICRRRAWLGEHVAGRIMTFVAVGGYPLVGALSIWGMRLAPTDLVLPVLAVLHLVLMTFLGLPLARLVTRDRAERGLFAIATGTGNNGFTMGAFVLFLLHGEVGMGLGNLYMVLIIPATVLFLYPLARHYATAQPAGSLATLMRHSLLNWRSIGLPIVAVAILMSLWEVPRPDWVRAWRVVDVLVYTVTPLAFFGIGLRLRLGNAPQLWRLVAGLAVTRFLLGAMVAVAVVALMSVTPWPLEGLRRGAFLIQGYVPTSVTMVALANMFGLRPAEASVLFVSNTVLYLLGVFPVLLWFNS
jgi:predicted permease